MRNVLVGVILGLLSVVQATPVKTVTQIPVKAEDEVLREAVTDGFLVDRFFPAQLSQESHKSNTTAPRAQQPTSSDPKQGAAGENSKEQTTSVLIQHGGERKTTPAQGVPHAHTSSTVSTKKSDLLDILNSDLGSGDGDAASESRSISTIATKMWIVPTISKATVHSQLFGESEESGSGSGMMTETTIKSATSKPITHHRTLFGEIEGSGSGETTETTTKSLTSTPEPIKPRMVINSEPETSEKATTTTTTVKPFTETEGSTEGLPEKSTTVKMEKPTQGVANNPLGVHDNSKTSPQSDGRTPGWIIILGFVVGVAALVLLCVAIATRDKWNGPNQLTLPENKGGFTNQQGELEMETFLPKEEPRENGKAAEYSVIPLEDLPEDGVSH